MNLFSILILLTLLFPISSAEANGDFWENCPGTACPSNTTDTKKIDKESLEASEKNELFKKEKELFEREKELFRREIKLKNEKTL